MAASSERAPIGTARSAPAEGVLVPARSACKLPTEDFGAPAPVAKSGGLRFCARRDGQVPSAPGPRAEAVRGP